MASKMSDEDGAKQERASILELLQLMEWDFLAVSGFIFELFGIDAVGRLLCADADLGLIDNLETEEHIKDDEAAALRQGVLDEAIQRFGGLEIDLEEMLAQVRGFVELVVKPEPESVSQPTLEDTLDAKTRKALRALY